MAELAVACLSLAAIEGVSVMRLLLEGRGGSHCSFESNNMLFSRSC